jgi:alpha/beta superfamily hydrolase
MVQPGQYLERPALIDAGGTTLEGLFHRGDRPPALLLCPPLDAEGMDAPLLAEVAWVAARSGHASLRFQHRGRGASQGVFDPGGAVDDALSVLAHLRETAGPLVGVLGLRGGCATAAEVALRAGLRRVVLVAPEGAAPVTGEVETLVILPEEGDPSFQKGLSRAARDSVAWLSRRG